MNANATKPELSRAECLGQLIQETSELPGCHLRQVLTFVRILNENQGFITPVEELVWSLVFLYRYKNGSITKKDVRQATEEFESHFDDMLDCAKSAFIRYPELVTAQTVTEEQEAS